MKKPLLLLVLLAITINATRAQIPTYRQYFDGADTSSGSIFIQLDTSSSNVWQVGPPQKIIFDSAATNPNALMTDTVNAYPVNMHSSFTFGVKYSQPNVGILAVRWKQKIDFDSAFDGGLVEYTVDSGTNWINIFTSPDVYNLYGYDTSNVLPLTLTGKKGFTGTDSVWRDVWLCFQGSFIRKHPNIVFRFTALSDSINNNREGWMIDNFLLAETYYHTVSTTDPNKQFLVYPTITNGILNVMTGDDKNQIDNIVIIDASGKIVKRYPEHTKKTTLDISGMPAGNYFINVHTTDKIEVHKIVLQH